MYAIQRTCNCVCASKFWSNACHCVWNQTIRQLESKWSIVLFATSQNWLDIHLSFSHHMYSLVPLPHTHGLDKITSPECKSPQWRWSQRRQKLPTEEIRFDSTDDDVPHRHSKVMALLMHALPISLAGTWFWQVGWGGCLNSSPLLCERFGRWLI